VGVGAGNGSAGVAGVAGRASLGSQDVGATFWRRWAPDQRAPHRKILGTAKLGKEAGAVLGVV